MGRWRSILIVAQAQPAPFPTDVFAGVVPNGGTVPEAWKLHLARRTMLPMKGNYAGVTGVAGCPGRRDSRTDWGS